MGLPALVPEIAAAAVLLTAKMAFAAFAGKLFSDIRRNAANRRLERTLGFVVEMLRDWQLGFDRRFAAVIGLLGH
jgi:hypothetical protein